MIYYLEMNKYQRFLFFCVIVPLYFRNILSYPVSKSSFEGKPDLRDEKRYPNGTVVGKYSYIDNEGNPVKVKYFADNSSYGVELKSIKVVDTNPDTADFQAKKLECSTKAAEYPNMVSDIMNTNYILDVNKHKVSDPFEYLNKEMGKINHLKAAKTNPDYETYYKNEVRTPMKCSKDKVRIYIDKEKRKIRNVFNGYWASNYCDQF